MSSAKKNRKVAQFPSQGHETHKSAGRGKQGPLPKSRATDTGRETDSTGMENREPYFFEFEDEKGKTHLAVIIPREYADKYDVIETVIK